MDILQHSAHAAQLIIDSIHHRLPRSECCQASVDMSYPEDPVCTQCGKHCPEHSEIRDDLPALKQQEIAYDDPQSSCMFQPGEKPFLATPAAIAAYGYAVILPCLAKLQALAKEHRGIDYVQAFHDPSQPEPLWFLEDGPGGGITALLPSDY